MSDRPDESFPEWLSALDDLLVRLAHLGKPETPAWQVKAYTVSRLQREFARAGCVPLADWLAGRARLNPADLTPEIEAAAPDCVIAGLSRFPNYALSLPDEQREQGLELDELHRRAIKAAQDQLDGNHRPPARVTFDNDALTVTLDGAPHKVPDPAAYAVYRAIFHRDGPRITKAGIRAKVRGVKGQKTIPRLIASLPATLRQTVHVDTGGYWHELPKPQKKYRARP